MWYIVRLYLLWLWLKNDWSNEIFDAWNTAYMDLYDPKSVVPLVLEFSDMGKCPKKGGTF